MKRHLALLVVCGGLAIAVAPALAAFRTGAYKGHTGDRHALSFRATQSGLSSFSFGSRSIRLWGNGVRSRIAATISLSASARTAAS